MLLKRQKEMEVFPIIKRNCDIILSFLAVYFFSPLILLIILTLLLDPHGKILFKQKRMGFKEKSFYIYKFNTINVKREKKCKIRRFLRCTHLDELPQFFNVLKADMSLVGPRPEIYKIAEEYNSNQKKRLNIKPGLTGLWQLSLYINEPIHKHLEYDFYYIKNQSFWLDTIIILKTIIQIFKKIFLYLLLNNKLKFKWNYTKKMF